MVQQLNRLTTIERVRDWVGSTTSNDDLLLTRLIDSASRFVLSHLQRPTLFQNLFSDIYDGHDTVNQMLRHWPVLSVTSVTVGYQSIAPFVVPPTPTISFLDGAGYVLEPWNGYPPGSPQTVSLRGYRFYRGNSNVQIVYTAGFVVQSEPQTVPASSPYVVAVDAPNGSWGADQGVTYASSGNALTPVQYSPAAVAALTVGQYSTAQGNYYFSSADANANVLISYSYVPSDVEHATMEIVGERYNYRTRIGQISKSLGGQETMSFSQKDMPDFIRTLLQPYKRVVMV